jgi:hypothetical protein
MPSVVLKSELGLCRVGPSITASHYHGDRIGGYPISSGEIESANKFICHTMLKRSEA